LTQTHVNGWFFLRKILNKKELNFKEGFPTGLLNSRIDFHAAFEVPIEDENTYPGIVSPFSKGG